MKYLFWNTNGQAVDDLLVALVDEFSCDIVSLAEYTGNENDLTGKLFDAGHRFYRVPKIACERITILTKYAPTRIGHFNESSYYTIKQIPHETLGKQLVAFVHLPSKLHMKDEDYLAEAIFFKQDLEESERASGNGKTIVVGDFNMNPFESGMVAASAIHSVPSREIATMGSSTVKGRKHTMFYNPMWNFMGDRESPPGTYYYRSAEHVCYFWNMFDQVIIRPSLIENFVLDSVKIITEVKGVSLVDARGYPSVSDHLPLYFEIR